MSASYPTDPAMAMREANQSDLVRRKLDMDALRKRLGDQASKEEKLRESCEGFEAIFLQKMWEQMRKTVPKEGYLHSKDEETYQSLFDIELCKKMASAGGIGLADMLYEQLSQQLADTGRTTTPSSYRRPLDIEASQTLMAAPAAAKAAPMATQPLVAEDLYSPLPDAGMQEDASPNDALSGALAELKAQVGESAQPAQGNGAAAASAPVAAERKESVPDPGAISWQGPGPVSAKPKPMHLFGRGKDEEKSKAAEKGKAVDKQAEAAPTRGMAPRDTLWPLADAQAKVVSRFGWADDVASGKRRWNPGVQIAAQAHAPVRAVLPGTVVYAGQRDGYGHTVVLEHKDGFRSYYGRLEPGTVKVGDTIRAGAEFAKIAAEPTPAGNGENSALLHFELKKGEMALNPESAINRNSTAG